MHSATQTLLEVLAFGAGAALHPAAVTHFGKFIFPYVHQIVFVDVALYERPIHIGAGADIAIDEHTADVDAGTAEEIAVANTFFVFPGVGLATELDVDASFLACVCDKLKHLFQLLARELQVVFVGGSADGRDGEKSPVANAIGNKRFFQLR